jgi:hypothetical protein
MYVGLVTLLGKSHSCADKKANSLYLQIAVLSAIRNHIAINTPLYREVTGNSYFKRVYTEVWGPRVA